MGYTEKKEYLRACKFVVNVDPQWMVRAFRMPNGVEPKWSRRIMGAVLDRHGLLGGGRR